MDIMRTIIFVGLGGMIGSIARYLIHILITDRVQSVIPWSTLTVNIAGGLLIGLLYAKFTDGVLNDEWRLLLITGLCGGFTTFSAFSYESFDLFKNGNSVVALLYILASVVFCLLATYIGYAVFKN